MAYVVPGPAFRPNILSTASVVNRGIKVMVYGRAGVGKTYLCSTAPAPIILSCESGLLSLRAYNLPYIGIETLADLQGAFNWIAQSDEARQFQTICLDSISEIIEKLLEEEKTKTKDPRKAYGEIMTKGVAIIRGFRDLPGRNVVLIAKEEWSKDEQSGSMFCQPSFPGQKLGPALPYYPDEVFQLCVFTSPQSKERVRALRCHPDQFNIAKDRSGALAEFEPPNLFEVFRKIGG